MSEVYEIPNGAAQRDLIVGEWLLIPDLANVGHHTVVAGETLETLAERWYGESRLWTIISIANHLPDGDPVPGTVLIQPRLNRKYTVVAGDTLWKLTEDNYGDGGADRHTVVRHGHLVDVEAAARRSAIEVQDRGRFSAFSHVIDPVFGARRIHVRPQVHRRAPHVALVVCARSMRHVDVGAAETIGSDAEEEE